MTNFNREVIYVGVTSDLKKRIWEHRNHHYKESFTDKYNLIYLIYYEGFDNIKEAITREKKIKRWNRIKKEKLIAIKNPKKIDLFDEIMNDNYNLL